MRRIRARRGRAQVDDVLYCVHIALVDERARTDRAAAEDLNSAGAKARSQCALTARRHSTALLTCNIKLSSEPAISRASL